MGPIRDRSTPPVNPGADAAETFELGLGAVRPRAPDDMARAVKMGALLGAVVGAAPPPIRVGAWALERPVGAGGMGVVYRARREADGVVAALKLLSPGVSSGRARFLREAALLRRVDHPRVVRYVDHGVTDDDQAWLAMEWLDGLDLAARLRKGPLEPMEALTLVMEAAAGVGALHRAGVIHRDLKPANLFLVGGGADGVRVVDLGIAVDEGGPDGRLTTTGAVIGSAHYMAPEQIYGRATPRSDVYALGVCLYEALVGAPPFSGDTPGSVLQQVLSEPPPSVTIARSDVAPEVDALIGRVMDKDPARRPDGADALALEIADLLAARSVGVRLSRAERTVAAVAPAGMGVGRARERGLVRGLVEGAFEDRVGVTVAVTGPPGAGRSALLRELGSTPFDADAEVRRVFVRAAPEDAGAPFALLRRLVPDGLGGALDPHVAPDDDPRRVADRLRMRWMAHVDAWATAPTVVLVDDLHLADLASVRALGAAARALREAPFALVFTSSDAALPALGLTTEDLTVVTLASPSSTAAAAPRGSARLADLAPELRRVARAVALVGPAAPIDAIAVVLGADHDGLAADLSALVSFGILRPIEGSERHFAHPGVRDALVASATEDDRDRVAVTMADWWAGRGRPEERAPHLERLGRRAEAAACWVDAARQAVAGDDEARAAAYLDAAERDDEAGCRGEVAHARAQLAFWSGHVDAAAAHAEAAMSALTWATAAWFDAASLAITALGQRGDHDGMLRVVSAVQAAPPGAAPDARAVALLRAVCQLGAADADDPRLEAITASAGPARAPDAVAWQARARGVRAATRSFDGAISAQVEAHRAHVLAGDPRAAAQVRLYLGSWYVWSGAFERAEDMIEGAAWAARRLDVPYLATWARYVRGKLEVETEDPARALAGLTAVADEARPSPRIAAGACLYAALAALRAGDPGRAVALAERASSHPSVAPAAWAARVLAEQARGGPVPPAPTWPEVASRFVEWDELVGLALTEAAAARGSPVDAPLKAACDRIRYRAATLSDPIRRHEYLERPHLVARTLAWEARVTGLPPG